ncbi:hypothetical protein [Nonomuraea recticatena]|uniref:hypothetical protein n=1 Tax=Nonomuraea recticatena TaxID=46178 RepID=UPI00360CCA4C
MIIPYGLVGSCPPSARGQGLSRETAIERAWPGSRDGGVAGVAASGTGRAWARELAGSHGPRA